MQGTDFDTLFRSLPADGWLYEDEARLLLAHARDTDGPILEVGSYCGRSTVLLASLGRSVHSVDPFDGFHSDLTGDEIQERFWGNLQARGIRNVIQHRIHVERWPIFGCGFAFLDGDHSFEGTQRQIDAAVRSLILGRGDLLAVHDYAEDGGGALVAKAVDDDKRIEVIGRASRLVICRMDRDRAMTEGLARWVEGRQEKGDWVFTSSSQEWDGA